MIHSNIFIKVILAVYRKKRKLQWKQAEKRKRMKAANIVIDYLDYNQWGNYLKKYLRECERKPTFYNVTYLKLIGSGFLLSEMK